MAKKPDYDHDMKGLREVQAEVEQTKTDGQKRQKNWKDIKNMVFQEWDEKPVDPSVKVTVAPGPRNKILGLRNLLASTSPQFNVPRDKNNADAERISSALEHAANTIWNSSNRVQGKRTEADMSVSAGVYDEIHIDILSTYDKLTALEEAYDEAKKDKDYDAAFDDPRWEARILKAKNITDRTPYLFKCANPEVLYPVWSGEGDGVIARFSETEMLVVDVRNKYGKRAIAALNALNKRDYQTVTVSNWIDGAYRYTWLEGANDYPIFAETHGLNFMPFVAYRVNGTDLFIDIENTNEPFLYGVYKSGIWQAQNAILTATRTALQAIGLNAQMFYQKADDQDQLAPIDHSIMAGVIQGRGQLRSMMTDIVTKDISQFYQLLEGMFEESTIYGTALGEKLSATSTFSETALLAQQGRLPIVPIQKAMQESAAAAMNIAMMWMKKDGKKNAYFDELKAIEIPALVEFEVTVEPDLPQDKVQAGQVGAGLVQAGITSKEWARDLLGEGQSDDMQVEIWTEQMSDIAFQQGVQDTLQMAMQAAQAIQGMVAGQGQQPQMQPPPQEPPQMGPQQGMPAQPDVMPSGQMPPEEPPSMTPEMM